MAISEHNAQGHQLVENIGRQKQAMKNHIAQNCQQTKKWKKVKQIIHPQNGGDK